MSDATVNGGDLEPTVEMDTEQARKLIQQEVQKRVGACQNEVAATLKKHNCQIQPQLVMTPQGSQFAVQIVPTAPQEG